MIISIVVILIVLLSIIANCIFWIKETIKNNRQYK
nr:MAG TPA: Integrin alpha-IIb, Integrin beta-3, transmembrane signaling, protein structure [Crassvirales sp.]